MRAEYRLSSTNESGEHCLVVEVVGLVGGPGEADHGQAGVNTDPGVLLQAVGEPEVEIPTLSLAISHSLSFS